MLLPIREAAEGPSELKSHSVLQWVESLALSTEKVDGKGPVVLAKANLSEASKADPATEAQPTNLEDRTRQSCMLGNSLAPSDQCSWDLLLIEQQDPLAWVHMRTIRSRAAHLEEQIHIANMTNQSSIAQTLADDYAMLQQRLSYTFRQLLSQNTIPPVFGNDMDMDSSPNCQEGTLRGLLDALYDQTIHKLNSVISKHHKKQLGGEQKDSFPMSSKQEAPPGPMQKQELAVYMTEWLIKNWINPYPDDEGLKEMATHCGVTTQVISNWLINARTRKWRPALQQACNMERPSSLLLEDSLNIFKGNPLRQLPTTVAPLRCAHPRPTYFAEKGRFHRSPSCQSLQPPPELPPSAPHLQQRHEASFQSNGRGCLAFSPAPISTNVSIVPPSGNDIDDIDMEPLTFDNMTATPIACDVASSMMLEPLLSEPHASPSSKRPKW